MGHRISRRAVLAGSGALAGVGVAPARAAEFTYKLGTNVPATHPVSARAREAADRILAASDGRFELRVFPSSQLGGDCDMLSQLRNGALEFFAVSGVSGLSTLIPKSSIYGRGFAFPDHPTVWRAMDGDLGRLQDIRQIVAREVDAAALRQRADAERLAVELRGQLAAADMTFTDPDRPAFRAALVDAGFYMDARARCDEAEWTALEAVVGQLG